MSGLANVRYLRPVERRRRNTSPAPYDWCAERPARYVTVDVNVLIAAANLLATVDEQPGIASGQTRQRTEAAFLLRQAAGGGAA